MFVASVISVAMFQVLGFWSLSYTYMIYIHLVYMIICITQIVYSPHKPYCVMAWCQWTFLCLGICCVNPMGFEFGSPQNWMQSICKLKLHTEIENHFSQQRPEPPFTDELVNQMRSTIEQFLASQNLQPNWDIPQNQPLCLHILQALSRVMEDPDTALFQHLIDGVPTGYLRNIPLSNCFEQTAEADDDPPPLSVHFDGWKSAHDDPTITTELVDEELRQGWIFEFPGTLEEAQAAYPIGVSVGKLGVATSTTRSPRLVVDSSIRGLNQNCPLPEKGSLPSAKDLIRSYPLRNTSAPVSGLSLDVKSAHKRVAIHPSEQGLVGFAWQGKYIFL